MTRPVDPPSRKIQNFKDLASAIQPRARRGRILKVDPPLKAPTAKPAEFFLSNRWRFA
tara:strand:- start:414 stop:587 length:174 start_codon:yes stop_codon:yes gene_type:complete